MVKISQTLPPKFKPLYHVRLRLQNCDSNAHYAKVEKNETGWDYLFPGIVELRGVKNEYYLQLDLALRSLPASMRARLKILSQLR